MIRKRRNGNGSEGTGRTTFYAMKVQWSYLNPRKITVTREIRIRTMMARTTTIRRKAEYDDNCKKHTTPQN
jgi:hypothetical protein